MKRSRIFLFLVALALMLGASAQAWFVQQPAQAPATFRITSDRVRVDFVAADKQGRLVNDLRPDEIEIFEDGKKQNVDVFFTPSEARQNELTSVSDTVRSLASTAPAAPYETEPTTVILIDSRAIDSNNFVHSANAVREFVKRHLTAGHAILIAEVYRGLRILTPLTRDRGALLAAVDKLRPQAVSNPMTDLDQLSLQVTDLREALTSLCYAMSGKPGRKHIVFFSEGYPLDPLKQVEMAGRDATTFSRDSDSRQAMARETGKQQDPGVLTMVRDVVSVANKYGVTFYTVDARGLVAVTPLGSADASSNVAAGPGRSELSTTSRAGSESETGPTEITVAALTLVQLNNLENAQNTLIALAAGTNGLAFFNSNDLSAVLRYSTFEQNNYYLASYVPSLKKKPGQFHKIAVRSKRPDIMIRSRAGYIDVPPDVLRTTRVQAALKYPQLYDSLTVLAQIEPAPGKTRVVMGVPGSQIQFRRQGNKYEGEVSFIGVIYDQQGKPVSKDLTISKGFNLALTAEQFQSLANQPVLSSHEVALASGQYKLVLLVEDLTGGTIGATTQEFRVP